MTRTARESVLVTGTRVLSALGLPRFLHSHLYRNELTILAYHAVIRKPLEVPDFCFLGERDFRRQIAYLKQHFCIAPLSEAIEKLASGAFDQPTVAITFDDGYQNNYDVAFPILKEYDCPATIFVSTRYVDSDETPWFCRLSAALETTRNQALEWNGARFNLGSPTQKVSAGIALRSTLKQHHPYLIEGFVASICEQLGVDTRSPVRPESPFYMLRTPAILAMLNSGLIEFGAHTHSHAILSRLSPEEQTEEVLTSLKLVEKLTGRSCTSFAYPNGSREDYQAFTVALLKSSGVLLAASSVESPNTRRTPLLELRRYSVGSTLSLPEFESLAHHVYYRMRRFRRNAGQQVVDQVSA